MFLLRHLSAGLGKALDESGDKGIAPGLAIAVVAGIWALFAIALYVVSAAWWTLIVMLILHLFGVHWGYLHTFTHGAFAAPFILG